ncbi:7-cyano-7-deazaguanine reductase [Luteibacter sp. Sphag1AF]|uniref:NADPH-dependent 7-cyano-7-deazaguanine reductase QueF n=1 Tax=Luteibacter sp. Sphag1AF TaxID=2587031 RepID=UPI00160CD579|nr:NADPH-dependent 7-cyano-7-deazaguanine reductase QueF [Luteibacter sp. Sphag1AF]MBB3227967.1 7-cyano-7-deazaguanine reductase [Luteibacter sp. Sphag1AF]
MSSPDHSPLGKATVYADRYDAGLLFPIPRQGKRDEIGVSHPLPFHGTDVWNGYELSWLNPAGKPMVAIAEFRVPATTPNIIESKSFKLYLNSFAQEPLTDTDALRAVLERDLSAAAGGPVSVVLHTPRQLEGTPIEEPKGFVVDDLDIAMDAYGPPRADFLGTGEGAEVTETLVSHLLRSNCPVTGQPDWGSVQIRYTGAPIDREGLLRYIVSFRNHTEFHEQCAERIFMDITARCAPVALTVYARYTRRGGLDINPFRSTDPTAVPANPRGARQ